MKILERFSNWYLGINDNEKEPPKSGIKRIFYLAWNFYGKILAVNIVFILCSLPVITMPAAFVGMNYYLMKMYRQGYGFSVAGFFKEYRQNIFAALPLGFLVGGLYFVAYYFLSLAGNFKGSATEAILLGSGIFLGLLAILLGTYVFVLIAMLDLPKTKILKNALILMLIEWKRSIAIIAVFIVLKGIVLLLLPYSLLLVLLGGIAIEQLLLFALVNRVVERRILIPYQMQDEEE